MPAGCGPNAANVLTGIVFLSTPTVPGSIREAPATSLSDRCAGSRTTWCPGDTVTIRWDAWTPGCESLPISFPLKETVGGAFVITNDQMLFRSPNVPPAGFRFCWQNTGLGETCPAPAGVPAGTNFQLSFVVPQLRIVCGYQLDVIIGGPLEIVDRMARTTATPIASKRKTWALARSTPRPDMLIDGQRDDAVRLSAAVTVNKQWVGTGSQPPPICR
jgi:hypothetical protein